MNVCSRNTSASPRTILRRPRNIDERERQHDVEGGVAEGRENGQCEQKRRERHQHVHDPHQEAVDARIDAGHQTDGGSDDRRDNHDGRADIEAVLPAIDDTRQEIAPERIGSKPMKIARAGQDLGVVEFVRLEGDEEW